MATEYRDEATGFITRTNETAPSETAPIKYDRRDQIEALLLDKFGVISPENQAKLDEDYPPSKVQESVTPKFGEVDMGYRGTAQSGRIYTEAELQNHSFFMANKADILLAQREGRVSANAYEPRG